MVRVVFFDLFLFATGYKVGPQFFRGLGRQRARAGSLTVVLCVTSLVTACLAAKIWATTWAPRRASWPAPSPSPP